MEMQADAGGKMLGGMSNYKQPLSSSYYVSLKLSGDFMVHAFILSLQWPCEVCLTNLSILQLRKLRQEKFKWLAWRYAPPELTLEHRSGEA